MTRHEWKEYPENKPVKEGRNYLAAFPPVLSVIGGIMMYFGAEKIEVITEVMSYDTNLNMGFAMVLGGFLILGAAMGLMLASD